jgi:hypothetical protein
MGGTAKAIIGVGLVVCLVLAVTAWWALEAARSTAAGAELRADLGPGRYGQEGVRVSGTAVVRTAPDVAIVRLGYESRSRRAREAKLANDRVMKKVISAMQKEGVARKDIQTVEYRLFPVWEEWPKPTIRTLFWHVLHMVEVRVHKVETVADVIDAASAHGADKVEGVQFAVEELHKVRAQAREMAAKVAREKGEQLARLMGSRLGKVVAVVDSHVRYWDSPWSWYGTGSANIAAQRMAEVPTPAAAADSVVSAGQVVVEAREEVVFALQ